ncbi:NACHT domain-containing protein [Micromonospora sp. WMMD1102]|uniref:NACHT domain-containing protein n=1 Tax=Micromonospora sp. WMMD1102 TaxID=3016105 RepID=UPI0024153168|nr:NACHT domain-containing protein [Micromonospora sp. WMMD1102]MDG4784834.1 NACHT domain-containing protein [Micromonospora sp. WMMD1102]
MGKLDNQWKWWQRLAGAAFVVAAAAFFGFLALGSEQRLDRTDKLASVGSLVLTAVGLGVSVAAMRFSRRPANVSTDPSAMLSAAAEDLARLVGRQWEREAAIRLLRPAALRVRWSSTTRRVGPSAAEILGPGVVAGRPVRLRLHGDVTAIVAAFRQLPARQLVVIGGPGAGKSALAVLLTVGLCREWIPGEPVPVLLNPASWNPRRQHFDDWLADCLVEQYQFLRAQDRYGLNSAMRLVDQGRVLPVLDGLDEMPVGVHVSAVRALTDAVGPSRPLVVTCRADEYEAAVDAIGNPLGRAAVVEIEPVTAGDAMEYLPTGQPEGPRRWASVLAELKEHPGGALAQTLSTPLMVYLARTAYASPSADPSDLIGHSDVAVIETRLLNAYLPAIYRQEPAWRKNAARVPLSAYPLEKSERWLSFLASHLERQGNADLAWWRLIRAVPHYKPALGLIFGSGMGLGFGIGIGLVFDGSQGVLAWLGFTLGFALPAGLWFSDGSPSRVRFRLWRLLFSLFAGLVVGYLHGLTSGLSLRVSLLIGLGFALGSGLLFGFGAKATETELFGPHSTLRDDRTVFLAIGLVGGVIVGLAYGSGMAALPVPLPGPAAVLMLGLFSGVGLGLAPRLLFDRISRHIGVVGLRPGTGSAWVRFVIARSWLAARGKLPWSLMRFLRDAHARGVLRQVGAVYQFRHSRLQEHLDRTGQLTPQPATPRRLVRRRPAVGRGGGSARRPAAPRRPRRSR